MNGKPNWDQYSEYECLEKILTAQHPRSAAAGNFVHDEMLFIVFHQIYELWFKQTLFELDDIQKRFAADIVDDRDMQPILSRLNRIVCIFKQLVSMMDVLETMPPQAFVDFRQYLGTASGFQSWQFRLIETRLGLRRADRIPVFHADFDEELKAESRKQIRDAEKTPSLCDQIDSWLARTPFVDWQDYKFWDSYRTAVHRMLDAKIEIAKKSFSGEGLAAELSVAEQARKKFEAIFDPDAHEKAQKDGIWRMSWKALQAGLFINIYRTEPILQGPYQLLNQITDTDSLLAQWRYRHALMVQRMVGMGAGTGGSSGYGYLMETLLKHRVFTDLFSLSAYLIPTQSLPALPEHVRGLMSYRHGAQKTAA